MKTPDPSLEDPSEMATSRVSLPPPSWYSRWMHRWERRLTLRDRNRRILPFDWGFEWINSGTITSPDELSAYCRRMVHKSHFFFQPPSQTDFSVSGEELTFPTPTPGPVAVNNRARCRLFLADGKSAVIVVPQWNADSESHLSLCRILQRLGLTAVRLTLPYHEERRPAGMARADFMVSPNLGRTIHATRQAVLEVRQTARWLRENGYRRIGIMGTSIGSCVSYLAFVHDPHIQTGVFNHVSSYFADVVWTGLSTRYVRWGLEGFIDRDLLREIWAPLSPACFIHLLNENTRPHLLMTASHDLTFIPEFSEKVFRLYDRLALPVDRVDLPCGHYTTGRFPYKYMVGWHACRYLRHHLSTREPRNGKTIGDFQSKQETRESRPQPENYSCLENR